MPTDPDRQLSIRAAPTQAELEEVWLRLVTETFGQRIKDDPQGSFAAIRAMVFASQRVAFQGYRTFQARFYRSWPTQGESQATSLRPATMTCTVTRSGDLDQARCIAVRAMSIDGPQGRLYRNTQEVRWRPFDEASKEVVFSCQQPGFIGNLEHLADENGEVTRQDGTADTDVLFLADAAKERTGDLATLTAAGGGSEFATITDSGSGDRFVATDGGLYVRIDDADTAANIGRVMRIVGFSESPTETTPGFFARTVFVLDSPEEIRIVSAQADDGGAFTDETAAARAYQTADDVTLLPTTPAVGDAYYFGNAVTFQAVRILHSTQGDGTWAGVWEYFDGASYVALSGVEDDTAAFRVFGEQEVRFVIPVDWTADTINSVTAFHVRFRVTSFTSVTTAPRGQAVTISQPNALTTDTGVEWTVLDFDDLGFELSRIEAPTGGRDNDLFLLGDDRGVFQQSQENDATFAVRASELADSVSPNAIRRAVNRILEPFNERGLAIDTEPIPSFEQVICIVNALVDDGGVFVDQTSEAQSQTVPDDMTMLPPTPVVGDAYYFGFSSQFKGIRLAVSTAGVGTWAGVWEYFDGTSYVALSNIVDPSDVFREGGQHEIRFDQPVDWENDTINGVLAFHVRLRLTSFTSITTQPLGQTAQIIRDTPIGGFLGFFWDIDAFDYYDTGDVHPLNAFKLLLHEIQSNGHIFIILPFVSITDSSLFYDDGPSSTTSDGENTASAWGSAFWDNASVGSNAVYAAIFEQVNALREAGVGVSLIRVDDTGANPCCS